MKSYSVNIYYRGFTTHKIEAHNEEEAVLLARTEAYDNFSAHAQFVENPLASFLDSLEHMGDLNEIEEIK